MGKDRIKQVIKVTPLRPKKVLENRLNQNSNQSLWDYIAFALSPLVHYITVI